MADTRCSCGTLVLAGEAHDCLPLRQVKALESIAVSLEYFTDSMENGLGLPVVLYQGEHEDPIRISVRGSVNVDTST